MAFTGRLGQSDSVLANIRLGYWAAAAPPGLAGASHGVATVAGALSVLWALAGSSAGVAVVSGALTVKRERQLTQQVVESDVNQTDRLRMLSQEVVETEVDQGPKWWRLSQIVIEVDGDNWGFGTGRILSGQFV